MNSEEIKLALTDWNEAWNRHDLESVMKLFHEDVLFDNWTGARITGKETLKKAWQKWFENHGGFHFETEDLFVDGESQKAVFQWTLDWPSLEPAYKGKRERRRGVDIIHFQDGKIIKKITFSKTSLEIDNEIIKLTS